MSKTIKQNAASLSASELLERANYYKHASKGGDYYDCRTYGIIYNEVITRAAEGRGIEKTAEGNYRVKTEGD